MDWARTGGVAKVVGVGVHPLSSLLCSTNKTRLPLAPREAQKVKRLLLQIIIYFSIKETMVIIAQRAQCWADKKQQQQQMGLDGDELDINTQ